MSHARKEWDRERQTNRPSTPRLTQIANPHNEFKPTNTNTFQPIIVTGNRTQAQSQHQTESPRAESVFEATDNPRVETYGFDGHTGKLIREPYYGRKEDLPDHIKTINVALAQFHYRHDANVEPMLHVGAQIFPYGSDRKPLKPVVYHAIWDTEDLDRQIDFYTGHTQDLIVALFPPHDAENIALYEHNRQTVQDYMGSEVVVAPKLHDIKGTDFFLQIDLTPKRWNDPLPKQEFWFRVTLGAQPEFVRTGCPLLGASPANTIRVPAG